MLVERVVLVDDDVEVVEVEVDDVDVELLVLDVLVDLVVEVDVDVDVLELVEVVEEDVEVVLELVEVVEELVEVVLVEVLVEVVDVRSLPLCSVPKRLARAPIIVENTTFNPSNSSPRLRINVALRLWIPSNPSIV